MANQLELIRAHEQAHGELPYLLCLSSVANDLYERVGLIGIERACAIDLLNDPDITAIYYPDDGPDAPAMAVLRIREPNA